MYKAQEQLFLTIYRAIDIVAVGLSFFIAFELRRRISIYPFQPYLEPFNKNIEIYSWHILLILVLWWYLLYFNKVYVSYRGKPLIKIIGAVVRTNVHGLIILGSLLFFSQSYWIHRTLVLVFIIICTVMLILEKILIFSILHKIRKSNKNKKYALIIGTGDRAQQLIKLLQEHTETGYEIVGLLDNGKKTSNQKEIEGVPIIGEPKDLPNVLYQNVIDDVFITLSVRHQDMLQQIILDCELFGINARIMEQVYSPGKTVGYMDEMLGFPFITYSNKPVKVNQLYIKDFLDFLIALMLLVILSPVFLVLAILIKIDSRGPVFFKQERVGLNGRKFKMFKFRSMVEAAENQQQQVECLNQLNGPIFKMKNDPRVTRVGKFIRRTSLDELPQLVNVLVRDMSLVGPRPLPVYESKRILGSPRRRLSMKPGITGLWQASGRSEIDFDRWMELDLLYIDQWSLWLDAKIICKTFITWISCRGAF